MILTEVDEMAELERRMTAELVRARFRDACLEGKRLGWPQVAVDAGGVAILRARGRS